MATRLYDDTDSARASVLAALMGLRPPDTALDEKQRAVYATIARHLAGLDMRWYETPNIDVWRPTGADRDIAIAEHRGVTSTGAAVLVHIGATLDAPARARALHTAWCAKRHVVLVLFEPISLETVRHDIAPPAAVVRDHAAFVRHVWTTALERRATRSAVTAYSAPSTMRESSAYAFVTMG
jgi:hypothetical protein